MPTVLSSFKIKWMRNIYDVSRNRKRQGHETFKMRYERVCNKLGNIAARLNPLCNHLLPSFLSPQISAKAPNVSLSVNAHSLPNMFTNSGPYSRLIMSTYSRLIMKKPAGYWPTLASFLFKCVQIWSVHEEIQITGAVGTKAVPAWCFTYCF